MSGSDSAAMASFRKEFAALVASNGEPAWLARLRSDAFGSFEEQGFPTTRSEEWRYTRLDALSGTAFHRPDPSAGAGLTHRELSGAFLFGNSVTRLVFVNGRFAPELSARPSLPHGVRVETLSQCWSSESALLRELLGSRKGVRERPFHALNSAFLEEGALVRIAANTSLAHPIHLVFVSNGDEPMPATHPRVLVLAERSSHATIVETYAGAPGGTSGRYFTNAVSEIRLGPDAELDHYRAQEESSEAFHLSEMSVHLAQDARFRTHSLSFGGAMSRHEIRVRYEGEGAECTLNGIYVVGDEQHVDHQTFIDHRLPHCQSFQTYRGILDGHARGVFSGRVLVRKDAQQTSAHQSNKNLLLSGSAQADAKPQLEIHADDVKCSHGVAIGQLEEDAVFYLRSRGIGTQAARAILTRAFAGAVTEQMRVSALRCRADRMLAERLSDDPQLVEDPEPLMELV